MTEVTIPGSVPSKKNSRNLFTRAGRIVNIPNQRYKDWHDTSALFVKTGCSPAALPISEITLIFFVKDHRPRDLTNMAESVMDLLVDCKIIPDDNWKSIPKITLILGGVEPKKSRVEVKIV